MNSVKHNATMTLGEYLHENVRLAKLFGRLGFDACCGGAKTLAAACVEKGLDPQAVLKLIEKESDASDTPPPDGRDWSGASLVELVEHLLTTHHEYTKQALPRLSSLARKVVSAHGRNHPELTDLERLLGNLRADLEPHLMKEEKVLFPMILSLEETNAGSTTAHCGSIARPITVMEMEHERVEALLREIRATTRSYAPPEDACETYKIFLRELAGFDLDLQEHIRKENKILFPKSLERVLHTER